MDLQTRLEKDFKTALKSSDQLRLNTLRLVKSAIKNKEIESKNILSDDEIIKLLNTQAKQRRDSITAFKNGGRQDLAANEEAELAIISSYLPAEMPDEELEKIVISKINELQATKADFGLVMSQIIQTIGGKASGQKVSEFVKRNLK